MARLEVTEESLRAELDDALAGLAAEAADCDPGDGWYPDTSDLDDLLDEVEDLADEAPDVAHELAGHVAGRIRDVLAAGNCLTDDLAGTLARAEELRQHVTPDRGPMPRWGQRSPPCLRHKMPADAVLPPVSHEPQWPRAAKTFGQKILKSFAQAAAVARNRSMIRTPASSADSGMRSSVPWNMA